MTREELQALGVPADVADRVAVALQDYVPKAKVAEAQAAAEKLQAQLEKRDEQLVELRKLEPEKLAAQITELQAQNAAAVTAHQAEMTALQKRSAITAALHGVAHDPSDIIALLDMDSIKLDSNGGLRSDIDSLVGDIRTAKPYLFREASPPPEPVQLRGVIPAQPGVVQNPTDATAAAIYAAVSRVPQS